MNRVALGSASSKGPRVLGELESNPELRGKGLVDPGEMEG